MNVPISSRTSLNRTIVAGMASLTVLTLAACGGHDTAASASQQAAAPPAAPVETITVQPRSIESLRSVPGRITASAEAEIRPQVTGLIQSRLFKEGETVEAGQSLYQIDPAEYAAAVESAKAALARAEAAVGTARETAKRFERLAAINAVSQQSYDEAVAAQKQAEAEVGIQKAALDRAKIDLARTNVRSPIAGKIGRSSVTQGALVTANQAQSLARVVQLDPIYVDMTTSSSELLNWKQEIESGKIHRSDRYDDGLPVSVRLENGTEYPYMGLIAFSEVSVDQGSGTVIVRAQLPNPDGLLLPGMFVKAEFSAGQYDSVFLVPQKAVQRTPRGEATAYVVNDDGKAEQRTLTLQGTSNSDWIVTDGLEAGDRVVVGGFQMLRSGMDVNVLPSTEETVTVMRQVPSSVEPE